MVSEQFAGTTAGYAFVHKTHFHGQPGRFVVAVTSTRTKIAPPQVSRKSHTREGQVCQNALFPVFLPEMNLFLVGSTCT